MSEAGARLQLASCPVRGYDLTGLPRTHACPECGFEYDRDCFELPIVAIDRGQFRAADGLVLIALIIILLGATGALNRLPAGVVGVLVIFVLVEMAWSVISELVVRKPKAVGALLITGEGVATKSGGRWSDLVGLASLHSVKVLAVGRNRHRITLYARGAVPTIPSVWFEGDFVATGREAAHVQEVIERRIKGEQGAFDK